MYNRTDSSDTQWGLNNLPNQHTHTKSKLWKVLFSFIVGLASAKLIWCRRANKKTNIVIMQLQGGPELMHWMIIIKIFSSPSTNTDSRRPSCVYISHNKSCTNNVTATPPHPWPVTRDPTPSPFCPSSVRFGEQIFAHTGFCRVENGRKPLLNASGCGAQQAGCEATSALLLLLLLLAKNFAN